MIYTIAPPDTIKEYAALPTVKEEPDREAPPKRENTVSYSQKDTVINGQSATVKTRVETEWKN